MRPISLREPRGQGVRAAERRAAHAHQHRLRGRVTQFHDFATAGVSYQKPPTLPSTMLGRRRLAPTTPCW